MDLSPGDSLDRFTVTERLASTGVATLYLATDPERSEPIVIKVFRGYFADETALLDAYFQELERVAEMSHPHVVPVIATGRDGGAWIAMERMPGGSLQEKVGRMSLREAAEMAKQVAEAMDAAHAAGVKHLDLKPQNVLIDAEGGYRLSDFGMYALGAGADPLIRSTSHTPLPTYMAPEQAMDMSLTERSDIYSLGVLLYHVLTGSVPFPGTDSATVWAKQIKGPPPRPQDLNPGIPADAGNVIMRAMATNPERRPGTARELATAFEEAVASSLAQQAPSAAERPSLVTAAAWGAAVTSEPKPPPTSEIERVHCHACGHLNPIGTTRCRSCWVILQAESIVGGEAILQQRALAEAQGRRSRLTMISAVAAGIFVAMVLVLVTTGGRAPEIIPGFTSASGEGQWAMHQLDPTHSGQRPGPAPVLTGDALWQVVTDGLANASPVASGGVVYTTTGDRRLLALDIATGEPIWELRDIGVANSSPALAGGLIFVGFGDSRLMAVDAETGERRWTFRSSGPIFSPPTVKDGILYVSTGGGGVHALNARTGRQYWSFFADGWIGSSPAVSEDDILVFGTREGNIHLLDAKTGASRLRIRTVFAVESGPAVVGDVAYVGTDGGNLTAVDLTERRRMFDPQYFRVRSQLFVWNMIDKAPTQRGLLWSRVISGRRGIIVSSPVITNDAAYVTSRNGVLSKVDLESRDILWTVRYEGQDANSPVLIGDTVFVATGRGKVLAIDAESGEITWEWSAFPGSRIVSTPVVVDSTLFVQAVVQGPEVHLFDSREGRPLTDLDPSALEPGWYYQFASNPCLDEPPPVGPFAAEADARVMGVLDSDGCSVFYAIQ